MKKIKYQIFTIMLFLMCITNTYATCTKEEIENFKKIEDEYTVKYEFDKNTKTYTIYFKTPEPEKYRFQIYSEKKLECTKPEDNVSKCINFPPEEYDVEIIGATNSCKDVLKTINLKLPEYNKFSDDPLCKGIEEFVLCNPTYNKEIDYETFVSRVNTYKKTKHKTETQLNNEQEEDTFFQNVLEYIKENLVQIIIILTFTILLTITIIITAKSMRKSRRLE